MAKGNTGGRDFSLLFSNLVLLGTVVLAALGWFVAFIGQAVSQSRSPGRVTVSRGAWFGIWIQLFVTIAVIMAITSNSVAHHRNQIAPWLVIALIFTILSIDGSIYRGLSYFNAMAAGYIFCAAADIIWLLWFTSDEDSFFWRTLSGFGNGNLAGPGSNRPMGGAGGAGGMPSSNRSRSGLGNGGTYGSAQGYSTGAVGSPVGGYSAAPAYGQGSQADLGAPMGMPQPSSASVRSGAAGQQGGGAARSAGGHGSEYGVGAGAMSSEGPPALPPARSQAGDEPALSAAGTEFGYRARALYAYQANADDPTEISFSKGETLDIVDNSGKWWQARKSDGSTGIVPSNYMQLL